MEKSSVNTDMVFAIVPEWVLALPVSANAIRVYCVLGRFINADHECWPSRRKVADLAQLSTASLDRALKELADHKAITITARAVDGAQTSNLYTIHRLPGGSSPVMRGGTHGRGGGVITRDEQNDNHMNENQLNESHAHPKVSEIDIEFDAWWLIWPRKIGKGQARTAYRAARKKTTAATLTDGATRVAVRWASMTDAERRYTPHPSTWLNGERWEDQPEHTTGVNEHQERMNRIIKQMENQ